jgi:hypothetical protein
MPSLDFNFLLLLQDDYTKYPCFIETGTYNGDTIFLMEKYFNTLHTIEISDHYYNNTKNKYNGTNIQFIKGDSSKVFDTLLPKITDKSIFFLDGHWSSGDTGKGDKDCPLIEELTSIMKFYENEAIIIIDDCRLFGLDASSGKIGEDWSDISKDKLLNIMLSRMNKFYMLDSICDKNDRLIIHINAKH